jgi:hypothetical protein
VCVALPYLLLVTQRKIQKLLDEVACAHVVKHGWLNWQVGCNDTSKATVVNICLNTVTMALIKKKFRIAATNNVWVVLTVDKEGRIFSSDVPAQP